MRIGGAVALSLPEADTRTVWLTMTPLERQLYDKAVARTAFNPEWIASGVKVAYLEMQIGVRYAAAPGTLICTCVCVCMCRSLQ